MKLTFNIIDCPECDGGGKVRQVCLESLTQARKAAGLTAAQMAKKTGYTADYHFKIESGSRPITAKIQKAYEEL